ncbi:helix-turn-helix domain-containing protein [Burkholderia thailandensis]|uniref:helix-turn-helix domain-containing protein n=1 Tax=Burkholderia thailandensis TaxID=57975 RepID=UPI003F68B696
MDRIDLFRGFARVVECASFTRAADTRGVPRASVSAAIDELDGRLGARLFDRTARQVTPTQDGAPLADRRPRLMAGGEAPGNVFSPSPLRRTRLDPAPSQSLARSPVASTRLRRLPWLRPRPVRSCTLPSLPQHAVVP